MIDPAYAEIVHWRRNPFRVLSCKLGKAFVLEMGRLFCAYAENFPLEEIAFKCLMIMPALLLQRPHRSAKTKEHSICLEHRLIAQKWGDINALLHEIPTIQNQLLNDVSREKSEAQLAYFFANLMLVGKV